MTELRPCPFCGCNDVTVIEADKTIQPQYMVVCYDCRARSAYYGSQEKAIASWNRRTRK